MFIINPYYPVLYRKKLIIKRKNSYFCSIFLAKIEKNFAIYLKNDAKYIIIG